MAQPRNYSSQTVAPPISPWMNLYQKNPGPLDNYHTYVLPQLQLRNTLQQYDSNFQQQGSSIQTLGQDFTGLQQQQREGQQVHPTGAASVFMSYSHYYPVGPNVSTTRGGSRASWTPPPARAGASAGSRM
jgi:hypothetical protein